jgi:hypothetical protein
MNRETYLNQVTDKAVKLFKQHNWNLDEFRDKVKVSCGFPKGVRGSRNGKVIGVHYSTSVSENGYHEIFINPEISKSIRVIDVLLHELCHAIQRETYGNYVRTHGKEFGKIARSIGLEGKLSATVASKELEYIIQQWIKEIGEYPHAKMNMNYSNQKKQTTRMLKAMCANGGEYKFRISRKIANDYGLPNCMCCHEPMILEQ